MNLMKGKKSVLGGLAVVAEVAAMMVQKIVKMTRRMVKMVTVGTECGLMPEWARAEMECNGLLDCGFEWAGG
jgi:hypothetical protein